MSEELENIGPPKRIGYIFYGKKFEIDEKLFTRLAKKKNLQLISFNIYKNVDLKRMKRKAKTCDIIFNNSGEEKAVKFVKLFEQLGCRVIETSKSYYRDENKWGLYLKCKKNKIPAPKTILLPNNIEAALKKLEHFNEWPVILKRIYGCQGNFVSKAENIEEAREILKDYEKKADKKWPTIAQKFMPSPSYRVTMINGKIVQTAIKKKGFWKKTGVYTKTFKKFKVTNNLKRIIRKISKVTDIKVCGVDLLRQNGRWYVLELNGQPCLGFFEEERAKLISKILDFLKSELN